VTVLFSRDTSAAFAAAGTTPNVLNANTIPSTLFIVFSPLTQKALPPVLWREPDLINKTPGGLLWLQAGSIPQTGLSDLFCGYF